MSTGAPCRLILVTLFLMPFATQAQQPQWPVTGPALAAPPGEIQAAAAKIQAEPLTEATVFFERDAYSFDKAGRLTYRHTLIYRVETESGVEDWSEIRVRWAPWYQNSPEIRARVIGTDGKVSTLDPKTITDGPAREESQDTYTDQRVRKAPLPGMAAGSVVEEEDVRTDKAPYFTGGGVYTDAYVRGVPTICVQLFVEVPASTNLRYKLHGLPDARIKDEVQGDTRHFSLQQGYLPGLVASDIELPTHEMRGPIVVFSTGESWADVAGGYRQLAEVSIDPGMVEALLPGPESNRNKVITQIVARLHKEIRYTGVEFGEASLQPSPPSEVLRRHYGDCKDKAALLVGMLRSARISAYMALLSSGPGVDVDAELPGMNSFDHAIVYVPPAPNADALWIDATAEYNQPGSLPSMDTGRLALVIRDGTTELTRTPDPGPATNELVELRDVDLAKYGPARITETSLTRGDVDASYRSYYGEALTRQSKEDLEKYAKDEYLAKTLANISHGDAHDLAAPFALKLDMVDTKRANTSIEDAVLWIPFGDIFSRLPQWFRTDPKTEGEKLTPQQEENQKRAKEARATDYDVQPFATEWRYTLTVPDGFILRALPDDKSTSIGLAMLTEHFEKDAQGRVKATLRFEIPRSRYTSDEVLALRNAVLAAYEQDAVSIWFDQAGAKLIAAGKTKDGLAADRALITKHPSEPIYHAQIAYAYLEAGLGDVARSEAEQAAKLDPKSAVAFRTLGWMCEFNEIGVQFAPGFDWDCAEKATKQSVDLDPDSPVTAANLAILDEYDSGGDRYSANAHLVDAIVIFRALKQKDKSTGEQYDDNVLLDLLYSGQYKELLDELEKLPASNLRRGLAVSATVALQDGPKGITAGIDRANQLSANAEERANALTSAGYQLVYLRHYPEAAEVLSAAAGSQKDSAATAQRIAIFRQLTPWKDNFLPSSDPCSVVQRMTLNTLTNQLNEKTLGKLLSRHAYSSDYEWQLNVKNYEQTHGLLHLLASHSGLPEAVMFDFIVGGMKFSSQGDDDSGYRITVDRVGSKSSQYFVTEENGAWLIVTDGSEPSEAGNQVLYLLKAGRTKEAQSLLNWMRERMHKGGGDDPLAGPIFPRFWNANDPVESNAMQLAGASLIASDPAIKDMLPQIREAWQKAPTGEARLNLAMLLAIGYRTAEDAPHLKEIAGEILHDYPDSYAAIGFLGSAYGMLDDWNDWQQMLDLRLAKRPDDEELLRLKASWAEAKGDWAADRAVRQILIDKGTAKADDYNLYGWSALFDNTVGDAAIKAARQATMLTNNAHFAELHTLACLYAATGKTSEARDLLLKAMSVGNYATPNSQIWFGFGSIYEQFGVVDAAIRAYSKVDDPHKRIDPTSTYLLAQSRLKILESGSPPALSHN